MSAQTWKVKKVGGQDVGYIRKLIIDSHTRQLRYADVALTQTNQLVRVPWEELDVRHDGIFLKLDDLPLTPPMPHSHNVNSLDTLEVPIPIQGKIGQSRRVRSMQGPSIK